ncbi:hypothetical protein [Oleidesulfovibrio sp.]|uniref:hypothetical protein n=1 Tax=Oleidesulfovibrio sp. TaxID=2909707 RepID=UPI003A8A03AA
MRFPLRKVSSGILTSFLLAGLLSAGVAQARPVEVLWSADRDIRAASGDETMPSNLDEARTKAFEQAVWAEALAMVENELTDARKVLLQQNLTPKASLFVQSYTELGSSKTETGTLMNVDVAVNRRALKNTLRSMGMLRFADEPVSYTLTLSSSQDVWAELGRLQALYNTRVQQFADVAVTLDNSGELWKGQLSAQGRVAAASGKTLDEVWGQLWARYFMAASRAAGAEHELVLQVSGWFTPDGVETFDKELAGWEREIDDASLAGVNMEAAGVSAHWVIRGASRSALERRLNEALGGRGLNWRLDSGDEV